MDDIISSIENSLQDFSSFIWGYPMVILLLGTHIYLTLKLKFPQRKLFTAIKLSLSKEDNQNGDVSPFAALATALAATIGTGNIVGVATAISLGGPGAVLWCWLTGIFGMSTKYAESYVGIKYRIKTEDGKMLGGPMYALEKGLKIKWLGITFAILTAIAAFGIGNSVQANAISENICELISLDPSITKIIVGLLLACLVATVIIGGVKSISKICTRLVPFMALFYILGCIYILIMNYDTIIPSIQWICKDAFTGEAMGGGAAGGGIMLVARYGIARGLFSNEAGMGSEPIVAAAAQTRNPARQALVSSSGVFWDTVVICAMTGLVIVTTLIKSPELVNHSGLLTKKVFESIPVIGMPLLSFGMLTFAFSTILGWCYYGERSMEYIAGKKSIKYYRIAWIVFVFAGCIMSLNFVWSFAEIMNAFMAIPNLIAVLFLSNLIARETDYYVWKKNLHKHHEDSMK